MKNKLFDLSLFLKRNNLKKESVFVNKLLKIAVPIEDILRLPSSQPKASDEEEGEDDWVEPEWESLEESEKDDIRVPYHSKEDWYGSLKMLGTSVILIPFDDEELTEMDLYGLGSVFGDFDTYKYEDFLKENNYIQNIGSEGGDVDILIRMFPALGAKINSTLKEKNLDKEDVVFMLINERTPTPRGFEKSPRYLSHDIGHMEEAQEDYFDYLIYPYLKEMLKYYIHQPSGKKLIEVVLDKSGRYISDEDEEEDINAEIEEIESEYLDEYLGEFFDIFSGEFDEKYDLFTHSMRGADLVELPDEIDSYNRDEGFTTFQKVDPQNKLQEIKKEFEKSFNNYIRSKDSGPLSGLKGKVVLYDLD